MDLNDELCFIAGNFFDFEIPKNKKYLFRYFRSEVQTQFLRYYLMFGTRKRFVEHTGMYIKIRWLQLLEAKFKKLELEYKKAREDFDLTTVAEIESGNYEGV